MISPQELRIGNRVSYKLEEYTVGAINALGFVTIITKTHFTELQVLDANLDGIKLTPEWLG